MQGVIAEKSSSKKIVFQLRCQVTQSKRDKMKKNSYFNDRKMNRPGGERRDITARATDRFQPYVAPFKYTIKLSYMSRELVPTPKDIVTVEG